MPPGAREVIRPCPLSSWAG